MYHLDRMSTNTEAKCCGTTDGSWLWCNSNAMGILFASIVWLLILYTGYTFYQLHSQDQLYYNSAITVWIMIGFVLWAHFATMTGDPGVVPKNAHPVKRGKGSKKGKIVMCGHCDAYKPPFSHHDSVSKRCISRMDHFCPWLNNAIGAKNQKNFLLFLIYANIASVYAYAVLTYHLLSFEGGDDFSQPGLTMARVLIFVLLLAILFTGAMIYNQCFGIMSGLGQIDRMKERKDYQEIKPIKWSNVFGDFGWSWFLPLEPSFSNPEEAFHYQLKDYPFEKEERPAGAEMA